MSNATKTAKRSDFKKYFQFMWRSLNIQASWNYERQMNMGFLYGIAPTLDELYPDENDPEQLAHKKEAYEREMAFYNCTPQTSAFTLGLAASMEEQYAADRENFNPETMNAVMHIDDEMLGENEVAQVFQAGFELNGKVLRHAIVQVAN